MTNSLFLGGGPITPSSADLQRYQGRNMRSILNGHNSDDPVPRFNRVAAHIVADPQKVGSWLAPAVENWVASAGPLVAQNAVVFLQWTGTGVPLIPVVDEGFAVALQANQKDELASRASIMDGAPADPTTLGGYVNVAKQVLDWQQRSADMVFALLDVAAAIGTDVWIADQLNTAASTGHADLDAALDSFTRTGLYSPQVVAAPPSWITANAQAVQALAVAGLRIISDHRLIRPLVMDPLAAIFVGSSPTIDTVDEPSVLGLQVGVSRYVSAGISPAGIAAVG